MGATGPRFGPAEAVARRAALRCLVMGPWNQEALPKWWGSLGDAQRIEIRGLSQRDELTPAQVALMVERSDRLDTSADEEVFARPVSRGGAPAAAGAPSHLAWQSVADRHRSD